MRKYAKLAAFIALLLIVFAGLYALSIPRSLNLGTMAKAADNIAVLDQMLAAKDIDWAKVETLYNNNVSRFVRETNRFEDNSELDFKVHDAIDEGKKGENTELYAIIMRRTLLRVALYHIAGVMLPRTRPENTMSMDERRARARVVLKPIILFTEQESAEYSKTLARLANDWESTGNEAKARTFFEAVQGMMAGATLRRLNEWRSLPHKERADRLRALVLQADMRQLYQYLYPIHAQQDKPVAWRILTEFTNPPTEVDPDAIEKPIIEFFGAKMLAIGASY